MKKNSSSEEKNLSFCGQTHYVYMYKANDNSFCRIHTYRHVIVQQKKERKKRNSVFLGFAATQYLLLPFSLFKAFYRFCCYICCYFGTHSGKAFFLYITFLPKIVHQSRQLIEVGTRKLIILQHFMSKEIKHIFVISLLTYFINKPQRLAKIISIQSFSFILSLLIHLKYEKYLLIKLKHQSHS